MFTIAPTMPWCVTRFSRLSRSISASGAGGTAATEGTKTKRVVNITVGVSFMATDECRIGVKGQSNMRTSRSPNRLEGG